MKDDKDRIEHIFRHYEELLKETEIDTPVIAGLYMPRVAGEIGILAVLNDQPSVFFENRI